MGLGADVMAGFPAEGAAEFGESLAFVERLPLSRLHVFPYSPRGGTRAASLTDGPPPQEAARRAGRLRELDKAMRRAFAGRNRGEGALVLAESRRRGEGGRLRGVTGNYLKVAFPEGARVREGSLVRAVIGAADPELGIPEALP
jgi:threonylcarbamoyladenosine tRNA methylthiotransferase MtaB